MAQAGEPPILTIDDTMRAVAWAVWTAQLAIMDVWTPAVRARADETGIHEIRKAIRRLRTSFRLFKPFFQPDILTPYRTCLKMTMRSLAGARDITVFLANLATFEAEGQWTSVEKQELAALAIYWQQRKAMADRDVQLAFGDDLFCDCLQRFAAFIQASGEDGLESGGRPESRIGSQRLRHAAPVLIDQRLAAVRAYEDRLADCSLACLHELRIQFKELRYTLDFFEPALDPAVTELLTFLNGIQDCLGALNDARVALAMLDTASVEQDPLVAGGAETYRGGLTQRLGTMRSDFEQQWTAFRQPAWQQQLATIVAAL